MPTNPPECIHCDVPMVRGFLLDHARNSRRVVSWVEGEPQFGLFSGVSLRDVVPVEVCTYRCPACGYLESYAFTDLPGMSASQ